MTQSSFWTASTYNAVRPLLWNCPRWLCRLLNGHALTEEWARYDTDQDGRRCLCGHRWFQYGQPGMFDAREMRVRDPRHI